MSGGSPGTAVRQRLQDRFGRFGLAGYAAVLGFLALAVAGTVGVLLSQPWLFPSLGPTVMLFFESPEQPSSRPLNTIVGHCVGVLVGIGCYTAFGLSDLPSAPEGGLTVAYVAAGALSVALTTLVLTVAHLPHPPAGASTLIVSLGILTSATQLLSMIAAVLLITAIAWVLNTLLIRPR